MCISHSLEREAYLTIPHWKKFSRSQDTGKRLSLPAKCLISLPRYIVVLLLLHTVDCIHELPFWKILFLLLKEKMLLKLNFYLQWKNFFVPLISITCHITGIQEYLCNFKHDDMMINSLSTCAKALKCCHTYWK